MTGRFSYVNSIQHSLTIDKLRLGFGFLSLLAVAFILQPLLVGHAGGQDGIVDSTFKSGRGPNSTVHSVVVQNDGKILIGGSFTTYEATGANRVARLNTDNSLDTSFNTGTGANDVVNSVVIQADGKILIVGSFTSYNGSGVNRVARLNTDGSLDTSFNTGTGANVGVNGVAVQSDGKILIGGNFTSYNGTSVNRIARLNSDGTLDTSFNIGSGTNNTVQGIAVQSDDKILIGGNFTSYNGTGRNRLVRLNTDGSLDTSFNIGSGINNSVYSIIVQSDGKILVGGDFSSYNGAGRASIARLSSDGSLESNFNTGTGANGAVNSIAVQSDGKILIGGEFFNYNGLSRPSIARLNASGSLDTSFNVGSGANGGVKGVAVQSDGKILIVGSFSIYNGTGVNRLARLSTAGNLDTSLNIGSGVSSASSTSVKSIAVQSDGKVLIGGNFFSYNGIVRSYIARLNSDGTLDTSFNVGSSTNNVVYSIAVQSDDKILIGGNFTSYNGTSVNRIARLNPDGTLDTSFNIGSGTDSVVVSIIIQSDGKILLGGSFSTYNGVSRSCVVRLNSDGTLDTSFNIGSGADIDVESIAVQSDGKIIIGGFFTSYNGLSRNRIARLNSDGSLDTSFNVGSGFDSPLGGGTVLSIAVQSDGKIIIGGNFTSYNGVSRNSIARLNSNGSLDTSFNFGGGVNNPVQRVVVQSDDKILIGGYFTNYNGTGINRIARLNGDGSLDTSFNIGRGANDTVQSIVIQANSKILIGGSFTSVDTYTRDRIARLENVIKSGTSTVLVSNPNPGQYGQSVTFTATTNPISATGTVTFSFGTGGATTSVTTMLVNGVASYMTSTLPVGDTPVVASYSGDNNFSPSSSSVYTQSITKAATSVSLTSNANPAVEGTSLSFTATLSPPVATGTVTFSFNGLTTTTVPVVNGLASYITNTLSSGTYTLTAGYGGDANYNGVTSPPYTQVIVAACSPQLVTSATDDGLATTCGTLSYALAQTTSGTISFALTNTNMITFTGSLTPTLKTGVAIDGGASGVVLNGNGVAGNGLQLGGANTITNLTIRNFGGQELLAMVSSAANHFFKVKVQS